MKHHSAEYIEYLKSDAWNERRLARLQKAKYRCERCGERDRLDVHHKTYKHLGNEPLSDLIALCQSCHWAADEERRGNLVPKDALKEKREKPNEQLKRELNARAARVPKKHKKKSSSGNYAQKKKDKYGGLGSVLLPRWLRK